MMADGVCNEIVTYCDDKYMMCCLIYLYLQVHDSDCQYNKCVHIYNTYVPSTIMLWLSCTEYGGCTSYIHGEYM